MKILRNRKSLEKINYKYKDKAVGMCHGVFDLLHAGHIEHFNFAKRKVDILVVSITDDKYVNKGPNKPYNNSNKRAKVLSALKDIDFVYINKSPSSIPVLKSLKPKFYFKGKDYLKKDLTGNLKNEKKELAKNNGKFIHTPTKIMSSSKIHNNYNFFEFDKEKIKFLKEISSNGLMGNIDMLMEKISKLEINLIGEPIIDEYIYSDIAGLTSKDPAVSVLKKNKISMPGGTLAIALMLSKFTKKVNLFTYGSNITLKKFFKNQKNINLINLSSNSKIQIKTRVINSNRFEKLIQITNILSNQYLQYFKIKKVLEKKKLKNLIVCDFGIDLFKEDVYDFIKNSKIKKYLNVQTNSLNYGKNLFTKYRNFEYLSLDQNEFALAFGKPKLDNDDILFIKKKYNNKPFSITLGKKGSIFYSGNKKYYCPALIEQTQDTTGCGDAYFSITTLLRMINFSGKTINFIGNSYAALHSQTVGNKKIHNKNELLNYVRSITNY